MKADYGWIILVVFVIIIAVFWKQITGGIQSFQNRGFDQEAFDRGAVVFADNHAWTPLENKACAMCHDPAYKPPSEKITMKDYDPDNKVILKNLKKKFKSDPLTTEDALYEQAMVCMTNPDRMALRRANEKAKEVQDLMAYLRGL